MKTTVYPAASVTPSMARRRFLHSALGGAGGLALAGAFAAGEAQGAKPLYATGAAFERALAEIEAADDKMFLVPHDEGRFLGLLARLRRARTVLEVGTAHGYWTAWLMAAIETGSGRLTTIELKPERVQKAREHLTKLGLARRVTFLEGNAHTIVPKLKGPFDLVFLNADKTGMMDYFKQVHPGKLAAGGVLVAGSAILRRDDQKEFLDTVRQHPDFEAAVASVTLEDGFLVAVRRR